MAEEGHQIGNHTYNHPDLTELNSAEIEHEIKQTEELIGSLDNGIEIISSALWFSQPSRRSVRSEKIGAVECDLARLAEHYQNRRWCSHVLR